MEMESYEEHFQYHDGQHQITQHKRFRSLRSLTQIPPSATSFIRRTLYGIMKKIPVRSQNSATGVE